MERNRDGSHKLLFTKKQNKEKSFLDRRIESGSTVATTFHFGFTSGAVGPTGHLTFITSEDLLKLETSLSLDQIESRLSWITIK